MTPVQQMCLIAIPLMLICLLIALIWVAAQNGGNLFGAATTLTPFVSLEQYGDFLPSSSNALLTLR